MKNAANHFISYFFIMRIYQHSTGISSIIIDWKIINISFKWYFSDLTEIFQVYFLGKLSWKVDIFIIRFKLIDLISINKQINIIIIKWQQQDSNPQPLSLNHWNGWMFVYKLSGCGFESRYYHTCFKQGVPWHSGIYRM